MAGNYIPKPFKRPSISLDTSTKKWQQVTADQISVGDIIVDFGAVDIVDITPEDRIELWNPSGELLLVLERKETLWAFTAGR